MQPPRNLSTARLPTAWLWGALVVLLLGSGWYLRAQGQPWWCDCGAWRPWSWEVKSSHNSQHLVDPYSFTHVLHGLLLYGLLAWGAPWMALRWRLSATIVVETFWELLENSQFIIDRYRTTTIALGYEGDSVINSFGDLLCCVLGFVLAGRLGLWGSIVLCLATELILLLTIRDSLLLSTLSLIYPIEAINAWQAGP